MMLGWLLDQALAYLQYLQRKIKKVAELLPVCFFPGANA